MPWINPRNNSIQNPLFGHSFFLSIADKKSESFVPSSLSILPEYELPVVPKELDSYHEKLSAELDSKVLDLKTFLEFLSLGYLYDAFANYLDSRNNFILVSEDRLKKDMNRFVLQAHGYESINNIVSGYPRHYSPDPMYPNPYDFLNIPINKKIQNFPYQRIEFLFDGPRYKVTGTPWRINLTDPLNNPSMLSTPDIALSLLDVEYELKFL